MPQINANTILQRGSGTVVTGSPVTIVFPNQVRTLSVMAQSSGGNTMLVEYTLDGTADTPLWYEWSFGAADDSQVWSSTFVGGFHQFRITGDGNYSYSWD